MTNQIINIDGLVKSHPSCHSSEGGNLKLFKKLDPRLREDDANDVRSTFYESINIRNHWAFFVLFLFAFVFFCDGLVYAQEAIKSTIKVTVNGLKTDDGVVKINIFNTEEGWLKKAVYSGTVKIKNNKCEWTVENVPYGEYAVFVYHDKNSNDELDKKQKMLPLEPFGYSNVTKMIMGPARWSDAKLSISSSNTEIPVIVMEIPFGN